MWVKNSFRWWKYGYKSGRPKWCTNEKIKKFGNANEFGHKFGKICKMVNCVLVDCPP